MSTSIKNKAKLQVRAYRLRCEGLSYRAIAEIIGVTHETVRKMILTFVSSQSQSRKTMVSKSSKRLAGKFVSENVSANNSLSTDTIVETDAQKIERLECELHAARMRADLYNEMINVAEQRFNISIRKKAGTKQ